MAPPAATEDLVQVGDDLWLTQAEVDHLVGRMREAGSEPGIPLEDAPGEIDAER